MGRRKNYKDGELEQEFRKYMFEHIYVTIRSSLIAFKDEKIVDNKLVTNLLGKLKGSYSKKVEYICSSIIEMHDKGHDRDFLPLYEYCWSLVSPNLADNFIYSRT